MSTTTSTSDAAAPATVGSVRLKVTAPPAGSDGATVRRPPPRDPDADDAKNGKDDDDEDDDDEDDDEAMDDDDEDEDEDDDDEEDEDEDEDDENEDEDEEDAEEEARPGKRRRREKRGRAKDKSGAARFLDVEADVDEDEEEEEEEEEGFEGPGAPLWPRSMCEGAAMLTAHRPSYPSLNQQRRPRAWSARKRSALRGTCTAASAPNPGSATRSSWIARCGRRSRASRSGTRR